MLELPLELGDLAGVEQIAQLGVADELAQLRLIDGQRLRAPFGERRVAVVDEICDVAEEQRRRERRRRRRIDDRDLDGPLPDLRQRLDERRQVEHVAQALAVGFEQDRERPEARRHGEQIAGLLALLPQRRPRAGAPLRQEQRPAGVLAKPRRKQRRARRAGASTSASTSSGSGSSIAGSGAASTSGNRTTNPSSAQSVSTSTPSSRWIFADHGHAPRRVDAAAARREHADAPVAELVAHAFDHDGVRVRHRARRGLIADVAHEILGRRRLQIVFARQARDGRGRR